MDYQEFIKNLCRQKNRIMYARATALTWNELPIDTLEGSLTGGSINIDGASAIRRTCSLTMVTQELNISNHYWNLNTKFKLEIGIKNLINNKYDDIIWFNQGVYVITSFSQSLNASQNTINLSGKDKMCLLNGEVGGNLEAQVDFGKMEQVDADNNITLISYPIKDIIRQAVHQYGGEPFHNIIINDLDIKGLELREYRGDEPLYMYRLAGGDGQQYENIIDGNTLVRIDGDTKDTPINQLPKYDTLAKLDSSWDNAGTLFRAAGQATGQAYHCVKIMYGQTVGYTETELTYAGELIANVGESLTSVLDKIVKMLGQFEYFYDVNGQFIFQQKRDSINFQNNISFDKAPLAISRESQIDFTFENNDLITAISNNINLLNVKNDFSVWGTRKGVGAELPIHMRYAIDVKPTKYTSIKVVLGTEENPGADREIIQAYNKKYNVQLKGQPSITYTETKEQESDVECDWREIIYQMASDYYKYNFLDDFELRVGKANPDLYPTGITGYEQYYIDVQGFWRELYRPDIIVEKIKYTNLKQLIDNYNLLLSGEDLSEEQKDELQEQRSKLSEENNPFYDQLQESYEFLLDNKEFSTDDIQNNLDTANTEYSKRPFNLEGFYDSGDYCGWNRDIHENPSNLPFWFDFLDSNSELSKFSVRQIGPRSKVANDNAVKAISYAYTPDIIFQLSPPETDSSKSYIYISNPEYQKLFTISAQGKSAEDAISTLVYNHSYSMENTNITAIPVYSLQPNTRIYINDVNRGLVGEYTVSKITLPLTYNGTMSITATKVINDTL